MLRNKPLRITLAGVASLVFLGLTSCAPRMIDSLAAPEEYGFSRGTSPEAVLAAETGEQLQKDSFTPESGQLLFRHPANDRPFIAHYYFVSGKLGAVAYYLSDAPYKDCLRHRELFNTLAEELRGEYGEPTDDQEVSSSDAHAPWNCSLLKRWVDDGTEVEVWNDGNMQYDYERVGVRYQFQ